MNLSPILFDKYIIPKGHEVPAHLPLRGAFAMSRDSKHVGWLHVLFFVAQKIYNFVFSRQDDVNMAHGMIILGRDTSGNPKKIGNHIVAHVVFKGIQTSSWNYLNDPDVTELVLFIPKDPKLRELIACHAEQSTFNKKKPHERLKKPPKFSITDILKTTFVKQHREPKKRTMQRTALAAADILLGTAIKNRRNQLRSLYCTAYAVLLVQSTLLIHSLSEKERQDLKKLGSRNEIAQAIFKRIKRHDSRDPLSLTYRKNPFCKLNARFVSSGYANATLENQSHICVLP